MPEVFRHPKRPSDGEPFSTNYLAIIGEIIRGSSQP
jgi:hypothetical protein